MTVTPSPSDRRWHLLPDEHGRRYGTLSLLMVPLTAAVSAVAWAVGTFVQFVVFDLAEQESLVEAGAWGYVAGACLIVLMLAPSLAGIHLGVRARALAERRLGTIGIVVNAVIAVYLVLANVTGLVFG